MSKEITNVSVDIVKVHPRNTEFFDDISGEEWTDFLEDIKTNGVIEPIIITQNNVIVNGHQRVRACNELGIKEIICEVKEYSSDSAIIKELLESNFGRVKKIDSKIKKYKTISEIEKIYKNKELQIKKIRDSIVKGYRKEISNNREDLINLHNKKCDICGIDCVSILEIHHKLPLQQGGNNHLDNLMVVCPNCHSILHKNISLYKTIETKNTNIKNNDLDKWIDEHYSKNSVDKLMDSFMDYICRKSKYGWEELTWI